MKAAARAARYRMALEIIATSQTDEGEVARIALGGLPRLLPPVAAEAAEQLVEPRPVEPRRPGPPKHKPHAEGRQRTREESQTIRADILRLLRDGGKMRPGEIEDRLSLDYPACKYALKVLRDDGLVAAEGERKARRYWITELGKSTMPDPEPAAEPAAGNGHRVLRRQEPQGEQGASVEGRVLAEVAYRKGSALEIAGRLELDAQEVRRVLAGLEREGEVKANGGVWSKA